MSFRFWIFVFSSFYLMDHPRIINITHPAFLAHLWRPVFQHWLYVAVNYQAATMTGLLAMAVLLEVTAFRDGHVES